MAKTKPTKGVSVKTEKPKKAEQAEQLASRILAVVAAQGKITHPGAIMLDPLFSEHANRVIPCIDFISGMIERDFGDRLKEAEERFEREAGELERVIDGYKKALAQMTDLYGGETRPINTKEEKDKERRFERICRAAVQLDDMNPGLAMGTLAGWNDRDDDMDDGDDENEGEL